MRDAASSLPRKSSCSQSKVRSTPGGVLSRAENFPDLLPKLAPGQTRLAQSAHEVKNKTLFVFPEADRETVKMSWHFVLFLCNKTALFTAVGPGGVSNCTAWLQQWVWPDSIPRQLGGHSCVGPRGS